MRSSFAATPLGSIAHIEMGQSPDSSTVQEGDHGGVPFLQGNAEFGVAHPTPRFSCVAPMKMCRAGDILISVRAPVGAMNIADRDYCIGRGLAAVRVPGMSPTLAAHIVSTAAPALRRVAQGTTFEAINKTDLASLVVMAPPPADREPLGLVLDTLDTTIRQTEAIIEKLKQVKQGLLHDLLTRGIDANGELRPPQSQAPHLYKDSPLGWIPRKWEALGLADIAPPGRSVLRTGPFGSSLKGEHLTEFGRPVVTIGSLGVGRFLKSELLYVSEATARVLADFELCPGDIAFSRVADVGRSVVVREAESGWIMSSNFMRISVDSGRVSPEFLQATLALDVRVKKQIRATVNSAGRDVASSAILMSLRFPIAPYSEQVQVIARMAAVDRRIDAEDQFLTKVRTERTGLMDDLLTGHVRVTPLLA